MSSAIEEARRKLEDLYVITGCDWDLRIGVSLTEPTCPHATIVPDDEEMSDLMRYSCWGDTIEEAALKALGMAHKDLVENAGYEAEAPWTNPADKRFADWLAASKARMAEWKANNSDAE